MSMQSAVPASRGVVRAAVVSCALVLALLLSTAVPASAATVTTVADGFIGPLGLAVGADGTIYVGESFAGQLTAIDRRGVREVVATNTGPGGEVAGVDALGSGRVVYLTSDMPDPEGAPANGQLRRLEPRGGSSQIAHLLDYEVATNPDAGVAYGLRGLSGECAAQLPPFVLPYTGLVDSHPYKVAITSGGYLVADAGGNDIVKVSTSGRQLETVAVLPAIPQVVTAEVAAEFGLPDCVVGLTYDGESVPTDVEVGPDGDYYVTTLPGAPELPGFGMVWRIDADTHAVELVSDGFSGATDLAVARDGTIYVAELFGGQISQIAPDGTVSVLTPLPGAATVELGRRGELYATTVDFATGMGSLVRITP